MGKGRGVTPRRALQAALVLALWIPLVWARFPGPEDPATLPVQARLQAVLAGRLARLADGGGPRLPSSVRPLLRENAVALLDEGLEHRPTAAFLVLRKALLVASAGDRPTALRLVSDLRGTQRTPLARVLEQAWRGDGRAPGARESIDTELTGYYRFLAVSQVLGPGPAAALRPLEEEQGRSDLLLLQVMVLLTAGNLGMGILAVLSWPAYRRFLRGSCAVPGTRWDPLGAVAFPVGYQWLAVLVGSPLATVLGVVGLPVIATVATTQFILYFLGLALLVRLLPRLAFPPAPARVAEVLGLGPLGARQVAAGLIGFWLAIPAVLAASWLTSRVLGRAPFSSNQALELLVQASPLELAVMALLVAVVGPFFEEVLFRGVLFAGLRGVARPLGAGVASALVFALAHGDPQAVLVLATLGGLFAFLYERTGSLWPAVIAHGLWNGTTTAVVTVVLAGR